LSAAVFDEVIALAIRGNRLEFHRLGADHAGNERYERALVIIHSASNSLRNRSFLPSPEVFSWLGGYWPLSIPARPQWSLLILGVAPFGAYRDAQFWNYPLQGLLVHEDGSHFMMVYQEKIAPLGLLPARTKPPDVAFD
jgi:hypothetical protein